MGKYTDRLNKRLTATTKLTKAVAKAETGDPWLWRKIALNRKAGNHDNKGLQDGRCNRTACQEPIGANPSLSRARPQWSMRDHEQFTDRRLFYCQRCAMMFNDVDRGDGMPPRCRKEEVREIGGIGIKPTLVVVDEFQEFDR